MGDVTGGDYGTGGLCGYNYGGITNCYSTGAVSGDIDIGGLVGYVYETPTFTSNFWDVNSSGLTDGVGNMEPDPNGVTGKTTAEMKTLSTFTSAGWDFIDTWGIGENQTYPFLRGCSGADLNCDGIVNFADFALFADRWLDVN
jgi:hypothetical protein